MEKFTVKNGKALRFGYTTGSCATAAAAAAAEMLLSGSRVERADITLPSGEKAVFTIEDIDMREDAVTCSVTKDGGDDPDATHG
ncbi:MAG: cobalt-precorrin-5B (C(1))-methyltransferase, partial [Emergencia timonensis]